VKHEHELADSFRDSRNTPQYIRHPANLHNAKANSISLCTYQSESLRMMRARQSDEARNLKAHARKRQSDEDVPETTEVQSNAISEHKTGPSSKKIGQPAARCRQYNVSASAIGGLDLPVSASEIP
jgi:hypothetical protein